MKAKAASCGNGYTMIMDSNNSVWAFGRNTDGELGLGDIRERLIPTPLSNIKAKAVSCGKGHTMIIDLNDNVWAFGDNY